jgi:hypothetical protein
MAMRWGRRKVECVPGLRFPSCRSPFPRAVRSCLPVVVAFFFAPRPRRPWHLPLAPAPRRRCHFGPRPALAEPCARLHPTTSPWRHRHHVCPSRVRSSRSDGRWCAAYDFHAACVSLARACLLIRPTAQPSSGHRHVRVAPKVNSCSHLDAHRRSRPMVAKMRVRMITLSCGHHASFPPRRCQLEYSLLLAIF